MTNEEAKRDFEKFIKLKTSAISPPAFVDLINAAIDKQIPKEPKLIETYPNNLHLCPSCGSTFITRYDGAMNYCNNCEQAIDWRPEE